MSTALFPGPGLTTPEPNKSLTGIRIVVPPRASAVPSSDKSDSRPQNPRDRHIQLMAERGRMGWQRATGYGKRNQAETAMFRYKHLIGPKLGARSLPAQRGEVAIAVAVLNRMTRTSVVHGSGMWAR